MTDLENAPVGLQDRLQQALRGTYQIERELGGGGMSIVFVAQELELHRKVVIKVLPPALEAEMSTERFRREIRLAIDLQHPNIVPVLTAGQVDGLTYYVMPFVKGESLEQRLGRGPITTGDTVQILRDVSRALAYAHEHGVVHRDIKPGNIMLTGGAAVVTDFGIAKALSSSREVRGRSLTSVGMAVGTPSYMAPEQAAADPNTDGRADLYALGVTAYEMLTGVTPFEHRTPRELLVAHLTETPAPLATRVSGVPPALSELVDQCLSKAPGARPASAAEVLSRLDAIPLSGRFPALRIPGSTRSLAVLLTGVALVVLAGAVFWARRHPVAAASQPPVAAVSSAAPPAAPVKLRVAVSTLDVPTRDSALAGPASLVADLLTSAIAGAGVDVVDRQAVRRWEYDTRNAVNGNQAMRDAAENVGVTTLVRGSIYRLGDSVLVQTQLVDARTGNVLRALPLVQAPVEGQRRDVLAPLRDKMLGALQLISAPELGPRALPATLPSQETAREITTGLELMAANDTARSLESLRHFERAVELDSSLILPQVLLADDMRYLMDERRVLPPSQLPRLEAMYRALAARRDDMTDYEQALLDYGQAEVDGDATRMLAARRRAAEVAPGSLLARDLYAALLRLNLPRQALATLQHRGPQLQPWMPGYEPGREDPAYWVAVSDIQHALGDHKASLAAGQRAWQLAGQSPAALAAVLYAWAALGMTDSLSNGIGRLLSLPATGEPAQNPANLAERAAGELDVFGHPDAAAKVRSQLLGWFEGRPPEVLEDENTQYQHALLLYHLKRYDQARTILTALTARDSLYLSAQGLLARIDVRQQHPEAADSLARRLERRATALGGRAEAAALFELALIESVKGNTAKALEYLQGAFARGESWQVRQNLHWYPDLAPLREHAAFKELITPQG